MHRPHFADDLPQLVAGFAHAVRRQLVERATVLMPNGGLAADRVLEASAGENECSAAAVAPEQLNAFHRYLLRLPRADELHHETRHAIGRRWPPRSRVCFCRDGVISAIFVIAVLRLKSEGLLAAIVCLTDHLIAHPLIRILEKTSRSMRREDRPYPRTPNTALDTDT